MVMSSNETLQMVHVLGHCIDDRIKELHTTIARYDKTKIVLDKFHTCITSLSNSTPLLSDQMEELTVIDSKDEAYVASSSASDNVSVSSDGGEGMNKLEEILSLAREIRSVSGSKSSKVAAAVVNNTQSSLTERKDRGIIASKGGTKGKATKGLGSSNGGRNYKAQTTAPKAAHHPNGSRNGSIHKPQLISSISSQKQNYMVNSIIVKKQQVVTNKVLSRRCDEAMINSSTHHHHQQQQQQQQQQQAFARDVLAQLQFASRYNYPVSLSKLFMNRELYAVHAEVYCKVLRTSTQPHSVLYDVIASHISSLKPERRIVPLNGSSIGPRSVATTTHDHSGSSSSSSNHDAKTAFISKLTRSFENLLTSYDRYFRVRMSHEQFHVSQLSAPDRLTLMAMWYKGRKLLDLYNYYIKSKLKQSSECPCSNCVLMRSHIHTNNTKHERDVVTTVVDMHNSKPLYTPLPLPSQSQFIRESYSPPKKIPTGASSVSVDSQVEIVMWYNDSKKRIQSFHRAFQDKVKLMVESSVGRHQLKDTIHSLKHCCEEQIKANNNHHAKSDDNSKHATADESALDTAIASHDYEVLLQQWIQSWKQFRSIYSILLNEAKDLNECMFINK